MLKLQTLLLSVLCLVAVQSFAVAGVVSDLAASSRVIEATATLNSSEGSSSSYTLTVATTLLGSVESSFQLTQSNQLACAGPSLFDNMTGTYFLNENGSGFNVVAFYPSGVAVTSEQQRAYIGDLIAALQNGTPADAAAVCMDHAIHSGFQVSLLALQDRVLLMNSAPLSASELDALLTLYASTLSVVIQETIREACWLSGDAACIDALFSGLSSDNSADTARVLLKIEQDNDSLAATNALSQALANADTEEDGQLYVTTLMHMGSVEAIAVLELELDSNCCSAAAKALGTLAADKTKQGNKAAFKTLRNHLDNSDARLEYDKVTLPAAE